MDKCLKKILNYAIQNVPYYKKRKNLYLTKFEKIPIVTRNDLEKNWKDFLSVKYNEKNLFCRLTTGTTKEPVKILFDPLYYLKMNFSYLKILLKCGYKLTKPLLHYDPFLPREYFFQKLGLYKKIWINSELNEEQQLQLLSKYDKIFLSYFPTPLMFVIFESYIKHVKLPTVFKIFTQGEVLFDSVREYIETEFSTPVIDLYGVVEYGLLAYEVQKNIYELQNELAFFEIVDENNEQVSENERGRVLLTSLGNLAFPLIRYEIGDFATLKEFDNKCKLITNINRISLEKIMKEKKKIEKIIRNNLNKRKKFIILYKKGELKISHDEKFLKKKRGKFEFLQFHK